MKIGIALRLNQGKLYINKSYIDYFYSLGYSLEYIDINTNLNDYDIFILPGGYDINPCYYKEQNVHCNNIDRYNDILDFKIIEYAYINNKKLLGICRGMQSINVYFNGSLKQDMLNHMNNNHFIEFNDKLILVNSFHHQSIKALSIYLENISKSIDGEIEIIKYKKIIGVQFHPELMKTPIIDKFILDFINEA
ncbi:MAG: hypothetical protein E7176_06025 [Erysipelotrichaceae bacterium]|nr:hypothetical protein [Erysipelotrichaceae bacterium]